MKTKLLDFFQSGLLEKYVLDETSASECLKVEHYIESYPEVESEYVKLQNNLHIMAKTTAIEAPRFILDDVKNEIKTETIPAIKLNRLQNIMPWLSIAASIIAVFFAGAYYIQYEQNKTILKENQVVVDELFDLRRDIDSYHSKLDNLTHQFMKLHSPETEKYVLTGNERAKELKTVAYINAVEKTSMIDVFSLPQLSEDQFVHVWAEMEDHFVNLGIIDPSEKSMQSLPYMENALGLSITIGSKEDANSSDNAVAEIAIKTKNN